jgi:hypothetical protein
MVTRENLRAGGQGKALREWFGYDARKSSFEIE